MSKVSKMMAGLHCKVWVHSLSSSSASPGLLPCVLGPPRQCLPGLRGEEIDQKKCQLNPGTPIVTRENEEHSTSGKQRGTPTTALPRITHEGGRKEADSIREQLTITPVSSGLPISCHKNGWARIM